MVRNLNKKYWIIILLIILFILFLYFILPISIPLILALLTALVLNPLIRLAIRNLRLSRLTSVLIVFFIFIILLGTIGTYTTVKTIGQVVHMAENAPSYISNVEDVLVDLREDIESYTRDWPPQFIQEVEKRAVQNFDNFQSQLMEYIEIDNIAQIFVKIPEVLVGLIVYLIALFLFMLDLPLLRNKVYSFLSEKSQEKLKYMNARLSHVFLGFFKAQFLVSLIILAVTLVGLLFITPEIAILMSIIIWLVDLIPIIGSIIVLGPWALYMFITGDMSMGIQLSILAIVLLAIRRTIEPKMMGHHIGLRALPTLISMYLGLQLIGFVGFFLGPLVVILFNSAREAGIIRFKVKF